MALTGDQWANMAGSGLAALLCAVFGLMYHLRAPWWRSEVGRNLMGFAGAVGAFCLYTVLVTLWPDGCVAVALRILRTVGVLGISVLMGQRIRILLKAQAAPDTDRTGV